MSRLADLSGDWFGVGSRLTREYLLLFFELFFLLTFEPLLPRLEVALREEAHLNIINTICCNSVICRN